MQKITSAYIEGFQRQHHTANTAKITLSLSAKHSYNLEKTRINTGLHRLSEKNGFLLPQEGHPR